MGICCISLTSFNFEKFCHMGNILHSLFKSVLFCCRLMNFRTSYWMCINSVLNCWSIFSSFCSNKGSTWFYIVIYIYNIRICACIIHTVALNISTTTSVDWSNVKESIWSIWALPYVPNLHWNKVPTTSSNESVIVVVRWTNDLGRQKSQNLTLDNNIFWLFIVGVLNYLESLALEAMKTWMKILINLLKFIKSNRYVCTDTNTKNTTFTYIVYVYIDNSNTKSSSDNGCGLIALLG